MLERYEVNDYISQFPFIEDVIHEYMHWAGVRGHSYEMVDVRFSDISAGVILKILDYVALPYHGHEIHPYILKDGQKLPCEMYAMTGLTNEEAVHNIEFIHAYLKDDIANGIDPSFSYFDPDLNKDRD